MKLEDLPEQIELEVTRAIIGRSRRLLRKNGRVIRSTVCPLALAAKKKFRSCEALSVGPWLVTLYNYPMPAIDTRYQLSLAAMTFVDAFDAGRRVEPETFTARLIK